MALIKGSSGRKSQRAEILLPHSLHRSQAPDTIPFYKVDTSSNTKERRQRGFVRSDVKTNPDVSALPQILEHETYQTAPLASPGSLSLHSSDSRRKSDTQTSTKHITPVAGRHSTPLTPNSKAETEPGLGPCNARDSFKRLETYDPYSQPNHDQLIAMDAYQSRAGKPVPDDSVSDSGSSVQIITERPNVENSPQAKSMQSPFARPETRSHDIILKVPHSETRSDDTVPTVPQRVCINYLPRRSKMASPGNPSSIASSSHRLKSLLKTPTENPMPSNMETTAGDNQALHENARSLSTPPHSRVANQIDESSLNMKVPRQQGFSSSVQTTSPSHSKQSGSRSAKQYLAPHLSNAANIPSDSDKILDKSKPSPRERQHEIQRYIPPHKQNLVSETPKEHQHDLQSCIPPHKQTLISGTSKDYQHERQSNIPPHKQTLISGTSKVYGAKSSPRSNSCLLVEPQQANRAGELSALKSLLDVHSLQAEREKVSEDTAKAATASCNAHEPYILRGLASSTLDNEAFQLAKIEECNHVHRLNSVEIQTQNISRLSNSATMSGSPHQSEDANVERKETTHAGPPRSVNETPRETKRSGSMDIRHTNENEMFRTPKSETSSADLLPTLGRKELKGKGRQNEDFPGDKQSGEFQTALLPGNWETRPSFDFNDDQKLAILEKWTTDRALDQVTSPAVLDTRHPDFLTGVGLVHGDTELQAGIKASLHNTKPNNTAASLLKRNQTAQHAIEERLLMQKMTDEHPTIGMSREEKRAKRFAMMEEIARRKQELEMASEHKPEANIYMRPVEMKDAMPITEIYNYYIEHSVASPELERHGPQYWQDLITECEIGNYPFVVAILTRQQIKQRAQTQRLKIERVVGFAWAVDYGDVHSAYRHTAELDICVHPEHLHKGIGKTLLDRMMFAMSPIYSCMWKDPVPFIESKGNNVCNGIGRETKTITVTILFAQPDETELEWKKEWLAKYGFQAAGTILNMAYKFGRPLGVCLMYHDTGRNISLVKG